MFNNPNKHLFFLFLILLINSIVFSQELVRIENITGLENLKDNNSVSTVDFDKDYDLDLFIVSKHKDVNGDEKTHSKLFRNENNGRFTDVTISAGLNNILPTDGIDDQELGTAGLEGYKYGSFWGDYNNDGYPDLFLTNHKNVLLYKNQQDGTFLEVTEAAGILKNNLCNNTGATWFDYNNDGFLDLFINDWNGCKQNTLYENNGDGTFKNISNKINHLLTDKNASYTMFPFDFNQDGWMDLYISNDLKKQNGLYINNSGNSFTEKASEYGLDNKIDDMSLVINDFNLDGNFDFFITGINENSLFKNNGIHQFSDVTIENRVLIPEGAKWPEYWAWGSTMDDFDLDGDEDLIITNGSSFGTPQKNTYFRNEYKQKFSLFSNRTETLNFGEASISSEVLSFDYDNDGDLDIFITNSYNKPFFFENKTNSATHQNNTWLKLHLEGTLSNKSAYGTEITLTTKNQTYKRYYNGVSFISQSDKPVHFGLDKEQEILELQIKWPSGTIDTYNNLATNVELKFTEANGFTNLSIQPSNKIKGCTDPNSCTYNPLATEDNGTCSYLDPAKIIGNTTAVALQEETYTYNQKENTSLLWNVTGGIITKGNNTNSITVKWGLEKHGEISVTENSNDCKSTEQKINIQLSLNTSTKNSSIARIWNEALLEAIRKDYARPTVHARNLFHFAIAIYDTWAIYNQKASSYLIGNTVHNYTSAFTSFPQTNLNPKDRDKAISYAAYKLLSHRFKNSPGAKISLKKFDLIMEQLGYNTNNTSIDYESGDPASLGNYIASEIINYGLTDGSNEQNDYKNLYYKPKNKALTLSLKKDTVKVKDPNRWQPLAFTKFIDQSGNLAKSTPNFLSPEWGNVLPFSLSESDKNMMKRDNKNYPVYHLPKFPPQLDTININESSELYKWNFSLVALWSAQLDPNDGEKLDISPASMGNIDLDELPNSYAEYTHFYKAEKGGDISKGHTINPITKQAYEPQIVPKADYARVLAEFWADGPDSETPPGHWFTILNYVSDHPLMVKKFNGKGDTLSDLEWDIKTYFILAGAMHDAAISAWSIKGWADYIRPISAIRYMAKLGQSTHKELDNYHPGGIPLKPGFIETIKEGDELRGTNNQNVGKIKLKSWRGHDYIKNPKEDVAGVGWILARNWWPYQRPSFVTPPFAGFISGHSTFSRAAAEVMTLVTGDEYFPGGMGEFKALKNEFLVFEKGPSVDVTLQWATYRDASDQTSLSRIWGGIHPPVDDIPGRLIGEKIGIDAYDFALSYFGTEIEPTHKFNIYPNPVTSNKITVSNTKETDQFYLISIHGLQQKTTKITFNKTNNSTILALPDNLTSGIYYIKVNQKTKPIVILK
ncbi:hypothetical protein FHR24_002016 [Wenyingzhuangia heitensis]|uniref:Por secretion system C-terminal sorting domain-containing protein n=1 Tax=Wenyingzhuangia heitensis TaxID=1487859 RepID=A0ABX0U9X8_9FLAO|nr:FG-GAP-like repeat-containing protein [Wenyingzhuangia heitensis]NIJ45548.1 hypothetical protein [Wenyingzhuangia heitensis]